VMRYRLFSLAVAGAAVLPVGVAAAAPVASTSRPATACSWRLDTRLPIPTGMNDASITATDGASTFAGSASNRSVDDLFHAVLWRGGRVSLLPTPVGSGSMAIGMNRRGDVVGVIQPASGGSQPVLWRNGQVIPLGVASPGSSANPRDIHDAGLIVGESSTPCEDNRATAWSADTPSKFTYVAAPSLPSFLVAASETGQVVGNYTGQDPSTGFFTGNPAVGTVAAGLRPVALPAGANAGQLLSASGSYLVGSTGQAGVPEFHATIWQNEAPTILSKDDSLAIGVNSHGTAIGYKYSDIGQALVWSGGTEQVLPTISSGPVVRSAFASVVTETNAIGGDVITANSTSRPVVWHCV
jgi:uncharacterized membrane protein